MRPFSNIYLTNRLFWVIAAIAVVFALGFSIPVCIPIAQAMILLTFAATVVDGILLFNRSTHITAVRRTSNMLSLSDENTVFLDLRSTARIPLRLRVIDELPYQLQKRDFVLTMPLDPGRLMRTEYTIRPTLRGAYSFGHILVYAASVLHLLERRILTGTPQTIPVYPSLIQMRAYELKTISHISFFTGVKKLPRMGHSYEFDQIKQYVRGDDIRHINWKATGRSSQLMVNHYAEERSQQIFCIIDKSRSMKMPFNGLSLMDYAINTTLTISNIAMRKEDRVGLISFSDRIETRLAPDKHLRQLRKIMDALHNEKETFTEANYELLYPFVRSYIRVRSLIFLFTNFESLYAIERAVNILRKLNKLHLLVVVFFENAEISFYARSDAHTLEEIYLTTVADKVAV